MVTAEVATTRNLMITVERSHLGIEAMVASPYVAGLSVLADDEENIEKFASKVDPTFLPRPQGSRPAIVVDSNLPEAFDAFRSIWKKTGRNLAAVAGPLWPDKCVNSKSTDSSRAGWARFSLAMTSTSRSACTPSVEGSIAQGSRQ